MTASTVPPDLGIRAVVTLCSTPRLMHLRPQLTALRAASRVLRIVAWVGDDDPPELDADDVLHIRPGPDGLRLSAARNQAADRAVELGAWLLVFLDADCVPGEHLLDRYEAAARARPDAVLCGPVTYLTPGVDVGDPIALSRRTRPHPARPAPSDDQVVQATAPEYALFWSLSFALTRAAWGADAPRFDERYEGYGGEDTDFAFALRKARVPLMWVGGAHAYHQHHPTSSPPWQHLDDILRNGARFAERWGTWPMTGWLEAFAESGAVVRVDGRWQRADPPLGPPAPSGSAAEGRPEQIVGRLNEVGRHGVGGEPGRAGPRSTADRRPDSRPVQDPANRGGQG